MRFITLVIGFDLMFSGFFFSLCLIRKFATEDCDQVQRKQRQAGGT